MVSLADLCPVTKTWTLKKHNQIGLDDKEAKLLISGLNNLLDDYQVFYMTTRGFIGTSKVKSFSSCI